MKKLAILTMVLVFVFALSASAQVPKPFTIYGAAGLSMPMSDFKDLSKTGFHADAQLGFNTMPKGEFQLDLGYHKLSAENDSLNDVSLIMAGGNFKLNLGVPAAPIKPFVLAGVGLAVVSWSDVTVGTFTSSIESQNKVYFKFGGGLDFNQFFIRAQYVSVSTDGVSYKFVPLSVGIKF